MMRSESLVADTGVQEPADLNSVPLLVAVTLLRVYHVQSGPFFLSAESGCSASPYHRALVQLQIAFQTSERRCQGGTEHSFSDGVLFSINQPHSTGFQLEI